MPNDAPDWTRVIQTQSVARAPAFTALGDVTAPQLAVDSASETITTTGGPILQGVGVIASFKAAAGQAIAQVGALGAVLIGSLTSVAPAFGQATSNGNFLLAWVTSGTGEPTTAAAGWVKALDSQAGGSQWAALWAKPNCGAGETAPTFTCVNGSTPMMAQLAEFSGVAAASPTDQTGVINGTGGTLNLVATGADVAFGDLVAFCTRWAQTSPTAATFSQTMNNGATVVHAGDTGGTAQLRQSSFNFAIVPAATASQPLGVAPWAYDVLGAGGQGAGTQMSLVLAASPGKTYTMAMVAPSIQAQTAVSPTTNFKILDGSNEVFRILVGQPAAIGATDRATLTDLGIKGTVGNSMTAQFAVGVANVLEAASCGAYLR